MKFLYGTDFHGDQKKYHDILNFAVEHDFKLIHLGADLLPKNSELIKEQKAFIQR